MCKSKQQLAEFLRDNTQIDFVNETLVIEDKNFAITQAISKYTDNIGGQNIKLEYKTSEDEKSNKVVLKKLIIN